MSQYIHTNTVASDSCFVHERKSSLCVSVEPGQAVPASCTSNTSYLIPVHLKDSF